VDLPAVNVLSLCSGVGGLDRGVKLALPAARTVCFVEIEAYACEVLASRMEDEALDDAPVWTNLRTFDGRPWRGVVDLVIGGYPCQPFSVAGKRGGSSDPRHLWPEIRRVLDEVRPVACFFENVPGHVSLGLRDVRCDLQELGYRVEAGLCSAAEVGASHRRQRLFILAVREAVADDDDGAKLRLESWRRGWADGAGASVAGDVGEALADDDDDGCQGERRGRLLDGERSPCRYDADGRGGAAVVDAASDGRGEGRTEHEVRSGRDAVAGAGSAVGDPDDEGSQGRGLRRCGSALGRPEQLGGCVASAETPGCGSDEAPHLGRTRAAFPPGPDEMSLWADVPESAQPSICRLADGLADRVDRLRAAGNGVVPQCAAYAFRLLLDRHRGAVKVVA
jgi:DNA (cytosine-5)-methyltransferase 1